MTVSALVSGGKDSVYSAFLADSQAQTVDELVVILPADPDSMMFHAPNLGLVELQARAWGKKFRSVRAGGSGEKEEVEAVDRAMEGAAPVICAGAIASAYQWTRLLRAADRNRRRLFTPLWGKDPGRVVRCELEAGLDIRLVHLAAEGLRPEWLGQRLDRAMLERIEALGTQGRPVHPAGEGGEFETLVVDAPFWAERLVLDRVEREQRGSASRLVVVESHLERKR
ncbi:MAG TPA: diphthine--ammonia ligase [Thermoplasmata archaeon]|nr:diphthine--ammonia ligase [Thermoplasmata archaeon]